MRTTEHLTSARDYLQRYPRLCAHVIAESLGYATADLAAKILKDAKARQDNYCEWIWACYDGDPGRAVTRAIERRHHHRGYMASYPDALAIVRQQFETGEGPLFASWF